MKKKSCRGGAAGLAQVMPHQHQVIVVGPDKVLGVGVLRRRLGKFAVDSLIDLPIFGVEVATRRHLVEQGPNDFVGKTRIEFRDFLRR